jgi:MoaA/NifB/PqqE/SkfB family radical SAM enzyme
MRKLESIDYWYYLMTGNNSKTEKQWLIRKMTTCLQNEYPTLCSLVLERTCNLNCLHCFFQKEQSSAKVSKATELETKILNIVSQLPKNAAVIHEGRILQKWHIPILKRLKEERNDISFGLIDNGSYLLQKDHLNKNNFLFDWIDISIDGIKSIHNQQRQSDKAFDMAITGLKEARKYTTTKNNGGKVTSLFTATRINCHCLSKTARLLMSQNLIDELHVTPASEVVSKNKKIVMNSNDWSIFWEQFKEIKAIGDNHGIGVYLKLYKLDDVIKLSKVIGKQKFLKNFNDPKTVMVDRNSISFMVDDIRILYIPLSICQSETFVIDSDGKHRLAYCIEYTLKELNEGKDFKGNDISAYTVLEIKKDSSFKRLYRKGAKQWINNFGLKNLEQEIYFFKNKS